MPLRLRCDWAILAPAMEHNGGSMFQLHVVLDDAKSWVDYVPLWITAGAALITVGVVVFIARNQNRLQNDACGKATRHPRAPVTKGSV
jgi:hypothetical protein